MLLLFIKSRSNFRRFRYIPRFFFILLIERIRQESRGIRYSEAGMPLSNEKINMQIYSSAKWKSRGYNLIISVTIYHPASFHYHHKFEKRKNHFKIQIK